MGCHLPQLLGMHAPNYTPNLVSINLQQTGKVATFLRKMGSKKFIFFWISRRSSANHNLLWTARCNSIAHTLSYNQLTAITPGPWRFGYKLTLNIHLYHFGARDHVAQRREGKWQNGTGANAHRGTPNRCARFDPCSSTTAAEIAIFLKKYQKF